MIKEEILARGEHFALFSWLLGKTLDSKDTWTVKKKLLLGSLGWVGPVELAYYFYVIFAIKWVNLRAQMSANCSHCRSNNNRGNFAKLLGL